MTSKNFNTLTKKNILVYVILLFINANLFAQSNIKGTVKSSEDNSPISGATVSLLKQLDTSIVAKTVTNADGTFSFSNIMADSFIVNITTVNYKVYNSYIFTNGTAKILAAIILQPLGKNLSTITVQATAAAVIGKGDTTQYSAAQYKVNPDATVEDLIKKMPGVSVARDGTVTAQGETVKKVTIDGKDFFGDDASAALKNLPAEVVDKIQVFDRLSDQARLTGVDDGNSVKAINVVTKAGVKNGQLGRVFAGYGSDDKYNIGGNSSFFKNNRRLSLVANINNINLQNFTGQDLLGINGGASNNNRGGGQGGGRPGGGGNDFTISQVNGISTTNAYGINYSNEYNKKLTLAASYFYNNSKTNNQSALNTETFLRPDTSIFSKQITSSLVTSTNHRINVRLEYNLDSFNSIYIIPNISFQKSNVISSSYYNSFYGGASIGNVYETLNNNNSKNNADRSGYNIRNSILYRHLFYKKGRSISFGINHTLTRNDGISITDGKLQYFSNNVLAKDSTQNQLYDNATNGYVIGSTIAYIEPLTKKAQLQFDYNPSYQKNNADQQTFANEAGKYTKLDTLLTNRFDNYITTHNAGITYRFIPGKEELFQVGFSLQNSMLESDRLLPKNSSVHQSFSNILPNFIYRKKFSKKANIRVFYRANVNFPSINQLQDVVNLANPIRVSTGNADLKQSYTHFLGSRYSYTNTKTNNSFFAGIFLQTAANYITNATYFPKADSTIQQGIVLKKGSQLTKPQNFDGYRNVRTFFNYSMPIKYIKSLLSANAGFSFVRTPNFTNATAIITNNFIYNAGLSVTSNISEFIDFTTFYTANFNQTNSNANSSRNSVNQVMGVQLNLLHKKGWFMQNDVAYQINTGLSGSLNQKFGLWNGAIGRKFLAKNAGELKLSVYDLLKQNQSIVRTVDENRIQDSQNLVLQQYFMLTFTYSLKNFGKQPPKNKKEDNKEEINRLINPR